MNGYGERNETSITREDAYRLVKEISELYDKPEEAMSILIQHIDERGRIYGVPLSIFYEREIRISEERAEQKICNKVGRLKETIEGYRDTWNMKRRKINPTARDVSGIFREASSMKYWG